MRRAWLIALAVLVASCGAPTNSEPAPAGRPAATTAAAAGSPSGPPAEPATPDGRWGTTPGVLRFRGNPTHTWYGTGPLPAKPKILWRYPDQAMCSESTVGEETRVWCGTGWTGQPVVWDRPDGITEVIFGAYDGAVHFVDASTGAPTRPSFQTGDLIKGSVTMDPDGYPLIYFGSRDNRLRIVALDREAPTELWGLDAANHPGVWNNDWDGSPLVVDDLLLEGGENGFLFAVKLGRRYEGGQVAVSPEIVAKVPGWNDGLLAATGDSNASIESSVVAADDRVYFANSAGRVVGVDLEALRNGTADVVFDWWAGDDIDASLVVDADGSLYVAVELERFLTRAAEVGQIVKLDPTKPDDPVVWSRSVPPKNSADGNGGIWATPALGDEVLYVATHPGELIAIDTASGRLLWKDDIGYHAWSSPVIIDQTLVVAVDCFAGGGLRGYDLTRPQLPVEIWEVADVQGCIESTPAVWNGVIYVGSRDGYLYAFGPP